MSYENKESDSGRLDRLVRLVAGEVIARARVGCKGVFSAQRVFLEPTNFRDGWVSGAKACESAMEEHVARDIEGIIAKVRDSLPDAKEDSQSPAKKLMNTPQTADGTLLSPSPCSASSRHNPIQRGMCEECFAWLHREHIDHAQKLGWRNLQIEWRDHYDNANDYHFQLRGTNPDGDVEDVPDDLPND